MVPIDRLGRLAPACQVSPARVVDAGRVITAAGRGIAATLAVLPVASPDAGGPSVIWAGAEMRAGGAFVHSTVALHALDDERR